MSDQSIQVDLKSAVQELMYKKGIKKYKVLLEGQTEIGDNYTGEIIFFKVVPEDGHEDYNFVIKAAKRDETLRETFPLEPLYSRELFAYTEVFPVFRKFVSEMTTNFQFDLAPEVYWTQSDINREILLFENLRSRGFKLWNRQKPWNLEHSLLVMKSYGKLHAISYVLQSQKPKLFAEWKKKLSNAFLELSGISDMGKFYKELWCYTTKILGTPENKDLLSKFDGFCEDIPNIIYGTADEGDLSVICHGDCWTNNFMFKYEDQNSTKPSEVRFLDFQIIVFDSPIKDLSCNIYATCDKSGLKHFDLLLETYYHSLSTSVKSLGGHLENFTYSDLLDQWKKYGKFGLVFSNELVKLTLLEKAEAPDIDQVTQDGKEMMDTISNILPSDEEKYKKRMLDLFTHFSEKFL